MNILFINSIGKDKFGGGEKWMVNAAKGLADRGHTVRIASKKHSRILDYARKQGVTTEVISIRSDINPLTTLRIARWLKRNETDILICNLNKDVRVAGLAARLAGTPVVLARHGMLLCSRKWKHKLTLTSLTDGIITNSRTIQDAYAGYGWFHRDFVKVIYNGLTTPGKVEAINFSTRFPGKKIIYSAGRLSEQKGFSFLIDAAAILSQQRNDLVFLVSGEGKLKNTLEEQIRSCNLENTFFLEGFSPDIYPRLKGCDLFVLASLFEGMPNVVMEAMAVGTPVIATDVNGARELVQDRTTGLIVPPADPSALADAISGLLDNPERLAAFGKAGKERVATHFTTGIMVDHLEAYLLKKLETAHR
ncbi:glycosyltransferase [Prosthecochloris sp. N3]|uniref:Glycosyltransferase n=1 Tax=Prosthecochloris ethylica TaxID=2743976 RepID=A0ABR9XRW9_9CHLB|nr:glycosyltransferase [Prosthecochloris ethylica]MBF0586871.1 glycosyltransferase [Prosthecochloris ethylica]MBF0636781.1 glycosyltransferase [Prosthecochloris ethylica]NUK47997.1 glycosyltransferase [Prosthecochloris ethylica]